MNRQTLLERNHRRQSRFARNLRRIALLLLALGSIGAVVHALWIAPRLSGQKAREALDIRLPAQR